MGKNFLFFQKKESFLFPRKVDRNLSPLFPGWETEATFPEDEVTGQQHPTQRGEGGGGEF